MPDMPNFRVRDTFRLHQGQHVANIKILNRGMSCTDRLMDLSVSFSRSGKLTAERRLRHGRKVRL